ncbi:hypothetical protein IFM89_039219 [Coptis chinensis]|uniref:Cation efflux protein transmembrane domain-containing protein n=1 Tax=Coptis chinensis TaxID=261450 RepID=A0A835I0G0_9MAGN|nr:hypothetical protein IFM89_039219 [Coptis chinensis]
MMVQGSKPVAKHVSIHKNNDVPRTWMKTVNLGVMDEKMSSHDLKQKVLVFTLDQSWQYTYSMGKNRRQGEEAQFLLESGNEERSWRLNFDSIQRCSEYTDKPPPRHYCLGVLGNKSNLTVCLVVFSKCVNLFLIALFVDLASEDVVAEYYQQQVEMLEGFNEMDALAERGFLPGMSKEERDKMARSETMAIRLSNIANMILFAAKVYASIRSGSLAIIASTLDSLLDLLSGFILWFTAFSMQTQNPYQYPIGKKRMQPLVSYLL